MLSSVESGDIENPLAFPGPSRARWLAFCHLNKSIQLRHVLQFETIPKSDHLIYSLFMSHTFPG